MARALAIVVLVLATSRGAHADPIVWTGRCGDAAALAAAVEVQAGRRLEDAGGLRVEVTVVDDGAEHVAGIVLITVDGAERREVRGRDCAALIDAAAMIVALALEDVAPPVVDAAPLPTPIAVPRPPRWRPRASLPAPPLDEPSPRIGARLRVGATSETGALPGLGLGATANASVTRSWLGAELGLEAHGARGVHLDGSPAGAAIGLLAASARGCGHLGAFELCAGAALGRMTAEGMAVFDARAATRRWSAAQAGVRWRLPLVGRLALAAALDATLALDRPRFVLDDGTLVYQPAPAGVALTVAVEVRLR